MIRALLRRVHRDDRGVAMMMAVVLSSVTATLVITTITVASHSDKASARGRHWALALHVAESGVEQAIAKIEANAGDYSGDFTGSTGEGTYQVTVSKLARNRYQIDSVGSVREGRELAAQRALRVTMAPPATFKKALFSYTSIVTKNNDTIEGDVWANQNVILEAGTVVHGGVVAATGYARMKNGAAVDDDIWSGGYDPDTSLAVALEQNSTVTGNVKASVVDPPDPISCGGADPDSYTVNLANGATIGGTATTWGSVNGSGTVQGGSSPNTCTSAAATVAMPTFTYAPENYDPATLHEYGQPGTSSATAVDDFHAYLAGQGNRISGTFYVNQEAPVGQSNRIDLTDTVITGDFVLITNTPIFTNGTTDDTEDAVVLLMSTYAPPTGSSCDVNQQNSECAIHLKNNFATSGDTAVLVYAPYGPTAVKNNALQHGAIYSDSIEIKNNQTLTYDSRIERVVGFGPVTLEVERWLEVKV